ncbi:hypothetical protein ABTZ78_17045 [Streptomyces bauhiniae]|uniref:hypothetical protein n=1 Tax=Streptomyces bauhiniae TaxID=2340725 RepID=UPI003316EAA9
MTLTASCPPPAKPLSNDAVITADDASRALEHFGHGLPGAPDRTTGWTGRLIALIAEADAGNRCALSRAYPGLVAAVQLARTSPTGIDTLRAIARY